MAKLTADDSDQQDERGPNGQRWPNANHAGVQANGTGQPLVFGFPSTNLLMGSQAPALASTQQQDFSEDMIQPFAATFGSAPQSFNQLVQMRQVPSSSNLTTLTTPMTSSGSSMNDRGLQMHRPLIQPHPVSNGNGSGAVINLLGQVIGEDDDVGMDPSSPPRHPIPDDSQNFTSITAQSITNNGSAALSLPSNGTSRRSDLFNFFAAMQAPSQPSTIFAISRGQTSNSSADSSVLTASPSSTAIQRASVQSKISSCSSSLPVNTSQAPSEATILRRPKDLLLHMIRGRTVFETSNGQMFTTEHIAYINAYYAGDKLASDLNQILAEPNSPDSAPSQENPPASEPCQLCRTRDPSVFPAGNSKLCTPCLNADLELPVSPTKPSPSNTKPTTLPSSKAGRKGVLDAVLARTDYRPGESERPAIAPEKFFSSAKRSDSDLSPSPQRTQVRKTAEPSLAVTKPPRLPGTSSTSNMLTAAEEPSTSNPPLKTSFDNFRGHTFLTLLLRKKPDIGQWQVSDVGIFLRSLRGMDNFAQKFVDGEVDGHALCLLNADNMVKDMGMSKCLAYKILLMVKLLKGNNFNLEQHLHLL